MNKSRNECRFCGQLWNDDNHKSCTEICLICKSGFKHTDVTLECRDCGTPFHKDHLSMWYNSHNECPVCKFSLKDEFGDLKPCVYCSAPVPNEICENCRKGCVICNQAILSDEEGVYCSDCYTVTHAVHISQVLFNSEKSKIGKQTKNTSLSSKYYPNHSKCPVCSDINYLSQMRINPIKIKIRNRYELDPKISEELVKKVSYINMIISFVFYLLFLIVSIVSDPKYLQEVSGTGIGDKLGYLLMMFLTFFFIGMGILGFFLLLDAILKVIVANYLLTTIVINKIRDGRLDIIRKKKFQLEPYNIILFYSILGIALFVTGLTNGIIYPLLILVILGVSGWFIGIFFPEFSRAYKK